VFLLEIDSWVITEGVGEDRERKVRKGKKDVGVIQGRHGSKLSTKVRLQTGDKGHLTGGQVWNTKSVRNETGISMSYFL